MIRFAALSSAALLSLAACNAPPAEKAPEPAPQQVDPGTPPAPSAPAIPILNVDGLAPLRIGMTLAEVTAAAGPDAQPDAVGGPDPAACDEFRPERAPPGTLVMMENGRLTRVSLIRGSTVKTDRGFALGDAAPAIKTAYGAEAEVTPHKYVGAPAEYITIQTRIGRTEAQNRWLVYEIGEDGRVQTIRTGGASVHYVEGCA
jgi:hypothetical protein